ncbi:MAG: rhomboid family intramembrane serine protease [Armatimonadetes bacterium]|nr:rhomboid family intramembrane serine protease [Armatimonadota bacterium]
MIPLRDDQPTSTFPIVTVLLIATNVLVFLAQQAAPAINDVFSMVPYRVTHPQDLMPYIAQVTPMGVVGHHVPPGVHNIVLGPNEIFVGPGWAPAWQTIFTSMFMHGSLLHIGGNMLYLWIFGNNIEDALGKVRFLLFYLVCGVAAALAQIVSDPSSLIPTLGASGAIAGVLAAYWVLYPDARVLTIVPVFIYFLAQIRAYWVLGFWIVLQVFQGLSGLGMQRGGGVAYFAHIGGFVAGLLIIHLLGGQRLVARQRRRVLYYPPPGGYY